MDEAACVLPQTELEKSLRWWRHHRTFPKAEHVFLCEDDKYNLSKEHYGKPFTSRVHWLPKLCEKAGVKPFGFHAVRHLSAGILDDAGYPITVIQSLLRHKSAGTTSRYLHQLRGMRTALDDAFERKRPLNDTPIVEQRPQLTLVK